MPSLLQPASVLCGLFASCLLLTGVASKGETPNREIERALRVVSVDFAFDGGSLGIEFEDASSKGSLLRLIVPGSLIREKLGVPEKEPLMIFRTQDAKSERLKPEQLNSLTKRLMLWEDKAKVHAAVTATLLAIQAGNEMKCFDYEAVEALEAGEWMTLFHAPPQADPEEDPFGNFESAGEALDIDEDPF